MTILVTVPLRRFPEFPAFGFVLIVRIVDALRDGDSAPIWLVDYPLLLLL
jgi:hypothetical protein